MVSAMLIRSLREALRSRNVDPEPLLARAGIEARTLDSLGGRISTRQAQEFWRRAIVATADHELGLHMAEAVGDGALDVVGYLTKNSATIGEAIHLGCKYALLLADAAQIDLFVAGDQADLRYVAHVPVPRPVADFRVALLVRLARTLVGHPLPLAVHFQHGRPKNVSEYVRVLGVRPEFRSEFDGLSFPSTLLDLPIPQADRDLRSILERQASDLLGRLHSSGSLQSRVRAAIEEGLASGNARLERIAAKLSVTPGTLRRRLHEAGTSYQRLLDEVRHLLASQYLSDETLNLSEVAVLLGFADLSAFSRAFKRWTGESPHAAREGWLPRGSRRHPF